MKFVGLKGWVENKCPCKDDNTKNVLLDVLKRDVTPLRIVICATYPGHLAWLFYIQGVRSRGIQKYMLLF